MAAVFAKRDVRCPFSAALEFAQNLHRTGAEHHVGPFSGLKARVQCEVAETTDYTDPARLHEALTLRWQSHGAIPLPKMRGLITVRPNGPVTELRMEGRYTPPLGAFGQVFDALIGRHIAQRTADRFLEELGDFIESEWENEKSERASPAQ